MQNSQDKNLMQDILMLEKGVCDLYMHGSIESSTQNINQAFKSALNESLCMQDTVYQQMKSKGWYQTEQAEQEKIDTLKQKFSNQMMG
ncbi:MAG: spore coat protein [Eubacterium sp.]|nr:spore coat protein [Eubacterium sp.]